jgi:hypothetical protein
MLMRLQDIKVKVLVNINVVYVVSGKVSTRVQNVTSRRHRRKMSEYVGKCRKTSKKYKNTHFFSNF